MKASGIILSETPLIKKPIMSIRTITPDMAAEWLKRNTHNRPIRKSVVARYADAIAAGQWVLNGEAIKFAIDGDLLDGQHRLHAIVTANMPIECLVIRDLRPEIFTTLDIGERRNFMDTLSLEGETNCNELAGAISYLTSYVTDRKFRNLMCKRKGFTFNQYLEILDMHPEIRESVTFCVKNRNRSLPTSGSFLTFLHYIAKQISPLYADNFIMRMADGVSLQPGSPILAVRENMVALKNNYKMKVNQIYLMAIIVLAWNAYIMDKPVKKIDWRRKDPTENFPEIFDMNGKLFVFNKK